MLTGHQENFRKVISKYPEFVMFLQDGISYRKDRGNEYKAKKDEVSFIWIEKDFHGKKSYQKAVLSKTKILKHYTITENAVQ